MLDLARQLNAAGGHIAVMVSVGVGAPFQDDIEAAEQAILDEWLDAIRFQLPAVYHPSAGMPQASSRQLLGRFLTKWSHALPKPLGVGHVAPPETQFRFSYTAVSNA